MSTRAYIGVINPINKFPFLIYNILCYITKKQRAEGGPVVAVLENKHPEIRIGILGGDFLLELPIVLSAAWASLTSAATFTVGFFVGLATSHACP